MGPYLRAHADAIEVSVVTLKLPTDENNFLAALRTRRRELGLTQRDLAELAGVSVRFIHDLENAKATVQFGKVLAVATTLGLDLEWSVRRPNAAGSEST